MEDYSYQASALSFITLLSLVPIVSIVLYFFSFFAVFNNFILLAENYIYSNFLPETTGAIRGYLTQFIYQTYQLPFFSILFSLITGIFMILTIEKAMNSIWHVQNRQRNFLVNTVSWFLLFIMPLFVGILVFINTTVSSILSQQYQFVLIHVISLLTNAFLIGVLYIIFPNTLVHWKDALLGGFVAACLFEAVKRLFILYITYLTSYEFVYGTLAIIPIFLVWIYLAWLIILYGALFIYAKSKLNLNTQLPP